MKHNINRLYLIKISKWLMILMPVIVVFFMENGLSLQQIFVLKAINSVSIILLEIPTGYFADVWGRKNTLIFGGILGFLGFLAYALAFNFLGFIIAEICLGIGVSFISGSDSALLYDTLKDHNKENEFVKYDGRMVSAGNFAEAIGGILGGFLASISIKLPVIIQVVVAFIAIPAAITLKETENRKNLKNIGFQQIWQIVKASLFQNKILRNYILLSSVLGCSTLAMAWFVQPFFDAINVPLQAYGILWTILNLSVGIVSFYAYKIEKKIGFITTIFLISTGLNVMYILTGLTAGYLGIFFILIFYIFRGVATPVLRDYINRYSDSDSRATILSLRSFLIRGFFAILAPLFGWFSDKYSIQQALMLAGGIFFIFSLTISFLIVFTNRKYSV